MTVTEFKNEFNILYDNISSNQAPGLDDYEISVFLTKGQMELIKSKFKPDSNRLQTGFEFDSKRRVDLKELIKNFSTTLKYDSTKGINTSSSFFTIPSDTFIIINEQATVNNKVIPVTPKTHDEYNIQIRNPFKKPYSNEIWRMDYSSKEAGNKLVELITDGEMVTKYTMRYVKYPEPIIVSDLTLFNSGLSVQGKTSAATSELDASVHFEIVDRAVEIAIAAYRENSLANKVQLDLRNE